MSADAQPRHAADEATPGGALTRPEVAHKRAWQTAVQGLAVDVVVALAVLTLANLDSITSRAALLTFLVSIAKTTVATVCSWLVRRYRDGSGFDKPTDATPAHPEGT